MYYCKIIPGYVAHMMVIITNDTAVNNEVQKIKTL